MDTPFPLSCRSSRAKPGFATDFCKVREGWHPKKIESPQSVADAEGDSTQIKVIHTLRLAAVFLLFMEDRTPRLRGAVACFR